MLKWLEAPYHNVAVEKSVTTASKKAEMLKWLEVHNVQFEENLIKPELYALIKQQNQDFQQNTDKSLWWDDDAEHATDTPDISSVSD
ncbi:hypothetical protein QE152_g33454 [Popillia japonica]|uniref:Uncharacterized protein n=1 Tax=Popillia japonica TaxID=7064 RepID=A0AAW1IX42_POPJA